MGKTKPENSKYCQEGKAMAVLVHCCWECKLV